MVNNTSKSIRLKKPLSLEAFLFNYDSNYGAFDLNCNFTILL